MGDKRANKVQDEIAKLNDASSNNELIFNPQTGELEIVKEGESRNPDATIITDVAKDGWALKKVLL